MTQSSSKYYQNEISQQVFLVTLLFVLFGYEFDYRKYRVNSLIKIKAIFSDLYFQSLCLVYASKSIGSKKYYPRKFNNYFVDFSIKLKTYKRKISFKFQ